MIKKISIVIVLLFALYSCVDDENPNFFDFGVETEFRIDEYYSDYSQILTFKISDISDSRCPIGVNCIWEGEARVKIEMPNAENDTLELSTHDQRTVISGKYTFELIDVTPYPDINTESKREDCRVKLKITR